MSKEEPSELIGQKSIIENFIVFAVFGVLMIVYGSITENLAATLSDGYVNLLNEALSLNIAASFSFFGLALLAISSAKGESIMETLWVKRYVLAISRVGLSTGGIVSGMMFGMGVSLYVVACITEQYGLKVNGSNFIGYSVFYAYFILPVAIFHLYLLKPWKEATPKLDVITIIYMVTTLIGLFYLNDSFGWKQLMIMLLVSSVILLLFKQYQLRNNEG